MAKKEEGQAIILIAIALVGLLVVTGLAVDGGRLLTARREAQNAADAAALGGTRVLAEMIQSCDLSTPVNDQRIWDAVVQYAAQNNVPQEVIDGAENIQAWYVDQDLNQLGVVGDGEVPDGTTGVQVALTTSRGTIFMGLLGANNMVAPGTATAMTGPVIRFPGGILPVAAPVNSVNSMDPGDEFYVLESIHHHNGGFICVDPDFVTCIGDPHPANAQRGWLNLNYIYNTEYIAQSSPFYRTFETNVGNRICGSDPTISTDDGPQGWASGECPYVFPIFAGTIDHIDGDFIHGDPGARAATLADIYSGYAGLTGYVPLFDHVYLSEDVADMDEYFPDPEGIGWPRAGGFLYHIVGFTAVDVPTEEEQEQLRDEGVDLNHTLTGTFMQAVIGAGVIDPQGLGSPCQPLTIRGVTLWR